MPKIPEVGTPGMGGTEKFYRAVSDLELQRIRATGDIVPRHPDYFVTQSQEYAEHLMFRSKPSTQARYQHLLEFEMEPGTQNLLVNKGARASGQPQLFEMFPELPEYGSGMDAFVHLKWERGALNYGLSPQTKHLFRIRSFRVVKSKTGG
jgi:hypothetical protein